MALKATQLAHSLMIDFFVIILICSKVEAKQTPYKNASNL
ncbi:hypothetical protein HPOKI128_04555 [Helicobacter pylori oki128]|nr:hypothetical protein HPOKI128_04555 [Helicobacter pylori oki128]